MSDDPSHLDKLRVVRGVVLERRRSLVTECISYRASIGDTPGAKPDAGAQYGEKIADIQAQLAAIDDAIADELNEMAKDHERFVGSEVDQRPLPRPRPPRNVA